MVYESRMRSATSLSLLSLALLACPAATPTPTPTATPTTTTPEPTAKVELPTHIVGSIALPNNAALDFAITLELVEGKVGVAKLWIPMQGVAGVPFDTVVHEAGSAQVELAWQAVGAQFVLELGDERSCAFSQRGFALECDVEPVSADEFAALTAPKRPQTPKPPFPYASEEVAFDNAAAPGVKLAGTLTLPEGPGPHPAVVLITGSGPQDRDETIFEHRPFAVLADHLTRKGIAVLRYDDRGVAGSTGERETATMDDFAGDAWAAIEFLRTRPQIDAKRIGVIGHSEGGVVGPAVALAHPKDVAFVVMLAGTGVPGSAIIPHQLALIMRANGADEATIAREKGYAERMHAALLASKPGEAKPALEPILREWYDSLPADERQGIGDFEQALADRVAPLDNPWMRNFLTYDPAPALAKLKLPVLAVNGTLDLQVDPEQNLPAIEKALKKNEKAKTMRLPGLNHLFQAATTGSPNEYATIETTLDVSLLEVVTTWIRQTTELE